MVIPGKTAATFFFNVTRCPYRERYRELGMAEFGVAQSCCRDAPVARGLPPRLRLDRTRTIMESAAYCGFRYRLKEDA